jgi:outer membrane protein
MCTVAKTRSSRREALTIGLLASGLAGLVSRAFGQQVREDTPPAPAPLPAAGPGPGTALKIGTVQIAAVFKGYEKVATLSESFKADVMARKRELEKFQDKARREAEFLTTLVPGTAAHAECEARIAKLKTEHEELRKRCEAEFSQREAEMVAQLYKEIRWAIGVIAQQRALTMVVRRADDPASTDPKTVVSNIDEWLLYTDSGMDITREVIAKLNRGN